MKKMIGLTAMMVAIFALALTTPVLAWDPPSTYVDGHSNVEGLLTHGDESTGGWAYGAGAGSFKVWGRKSAEGEAEAKGEVEGESSASTDPSSANSFSSSRVRSRGAEIEGKFGKVQVSGTAEQANWATIDLGESGFISGGNTTEGEYSGSLKGRGDLSLEGGAVAKGTTTLTATDTTTQGETVGRAKAWLEGAGCGNDPSVKGEGFLVGGNALNQGNVTAVTNFDGTANFNASGPESPAGKLKITGGTEIQVTPSGVSMKSSVKSGAQAIGK